MYNIHRFFAGCHAYELNCIFLCYRADIIIPSAYKSKASRGLAPLEVFERAGKEVRKGKKVQQGI
jgi:hypothetical protein